MQIVHTEHKLSDIIALFETGFKVADGDKCIERKSFVDAAQGIVIFRHTIKKQGEDEPAPLIVLPNAGP